MQPSDPSQQWQPQSGAPYPGPASGVPYPGQPSAPPYQQPQYQQPPYPQYQPPAYQAPSPYVAPPAGAAPKKRGGAPIALIVGIGALVIIVVAIVAVTALRTGSKKAGTPPVAAGSPTDGKIDKCLVGKWKQTSYQKNVPLADTDVGKRENLSTIKFSGQGKVWTISADGSAIEDDSATVYTGKTDDGRIVTATYTGSTTWKLTSADRKIYYAGIKGTAVITIGVDGKDAGRIELEPNTDAVNYTCAGDVWRTTNPTDPNAWNTYERQ